MVHFCILRHLQLSTYAEHASLLKFVRGFVPCYMQRHPPQSFSVLQFVRDTIIPASAIATSSSRDLDVAKVFTKRKAEADLEALRALVYFLPQKAIVSQSPTITC